MDKIIITSSTFHSIPYNEYYIQNKQPLGLVFVQHGFESNKNRGADYLCVNLARLGYHAVAIDAYKHGSRIEEPFLTGSAVEKFKDAFNVIDKTADDILYLYDNVYKKTFPFFDFIGVSMGGMIAYNALLKTTHINKLIPVISTPYLYDFARWVVEQEDNVEFYKLFEEIKDQIKEIDPSDRIIKAEYRNIHIINTVKDNIVPANFSEDFYKHNYKANLTLALFDANHTVNRQMQEEILTLIANEKVVL